MKHIFWFWGAYFVFSCFVFVGIFCFLGSVSAQTNTCVNNCPSPSTGSCSCVSSSASCTSPKTVFSSGNGYCQEHYSSSSYVCCRTPSADSSDEEKCKDGFVEKSGVCFPESSEVGLSDKVVSDILSGLMKWMLGIFGFLAIIAFVISGIQYLSAAGNMNMIETAKRNMTWSIVGVIVALAGLVIIIAIDMLLKTTL